MPTSVRQTTKEGVQRMSGEKIYKGEKYCFTRGEKPLGRGGNGTVYDFSPLQERVQRKDIKDL